MGRWTRVTYIYEFGSRGYSMVRRQVRDMDIQLDDVTRALPPHELAARFNAIYAEHAGSWMHGFARPRVRDKDVARRRGEARRGPARGYVHVRRRRQRDVDDARVRGRDAAPRVPWRTRGSRRRTAAGTLASTAPEGECDPATPAVVTFGDGPAMYPVHEYLADE